MSFNFFISGKAFRTIYIDADEVESQVLNEGVQGNWKEMRGSYKFCPPFFFFNNLVTCQEIGWKGG